MTMGGLILILAIFGAVALIFAIAGGIVASEDPAAAVVFAVFLRFLTIVATLAALAIIAALTVPLIASVF